jgi:heptosyltransferase-2
LAIIPRSDADYYQATFISYLSGARMRLGYTENFYEWKERFNHGFDRLLTHVLNPSPKHEVENGLEIIRYLGGKVENTKIEAWLNPSDIEFAQKIQKKYNFSENPFVIALGVGANADKRQWPILNFVKLAQWLNQQFNAQILLVGGKNEESLGREFEKNFSKDTINILGKSNLRQTIAVLKMCKIFIGNDSGPMHLATAAGINVIELSCYPRDGRPFHPNSPKLYGPWGVPSVILQPERGLDNCKNGCDALKAHCIAQITVDAVQQAVLHLTNRTGI